MRYVWKYSLQAGLGQTVYIPKFCKIIGVGVQLGVINLYVEADSDSMHTDRRIFSVYAPYQEIRQNSHSIVGIALDGALEWIVYEDSSL